MLWRNFADHKALAILARRFDESRVIVTGGGDGF
jgi:hypothetical protein